MDVQSEDNALDSASKALGEELSAPDEFVEAAQHTIVPFLEEFGFSVARIGPRFVEMRSASLQCRLYQGLRSDVIGIDLDDSPKTGRRGWRSATLGHMLRAIGTSHPGMAVRGSRLIYDRLNWLGEFLASNFQKVLRGDRTSLDSLFAVADEANKEYNYKLDVVPVLSRADIAFGEHRYRDVIELLEPLKRESKLNELHKRKLAYAQKIVAKEKPRDGVA